MTDFFGMKRYSGETLTMEYITPSMYRKILNVITDIYNTTAYDKKYDLFRFKDVLDSFSEGQIMNKVWAVEELNN